MAKLDQTTGRPRAFDESAVLDKALELFWRNGYQPTTTRDLESELGLSQSSIYNAFGSKRALFMAALDRYEQMTTDELVVPLETSDQGLQAIVEFFEALGRWVTRDGRKGCMVINLMAEDAGEDEEITRRTSVYRRRVRQALKAALIRAERRGESKPGFAEVRSDLLFGNVLGLNIAARGGAPRPEIRRLISGTDHVLTEWRLSPG